MQQNYMTKRGGSNAAWIAGGAALAVGAALVAVGLGSRRRRDKLARGALAAMPTRLTKVRRSIVVNAPRDEIYEFWRDYRNLVGIMPHIERVEYDPGVPLSHWVARAPGGVTLEWDCATVDDWPGERISWRSDEGTADLRNHGMLTLADAPGGGTEVSLQVVFDAPMGPAGRMAGKLAGFDPGVIAQQSLENLKRRFEAPGT